MPPHRGQPLLLPAQREKLPRRPPGKSSPPAQHDGAFAARIRAPWKQTALRGFCGAGHTASVKGVGRARTASPGTGLAPFANPHPSGTGTVYSLPLTRAQGESCWTAPVKGGGSHQAQGPVSSCGQPDASGKLPSGHKGRGLPMSLCCAGAEPGWQPPGLPDSTMPRPYWPHPP